VGLSVPKPSCQAVMLLQQGNYAGIANFFQIPAHSYFRAMNDQAGRAQIEAIMNELKSMTDWKKT